MMFGLGATMTGKDVRNVRSRPQGLFVGVLSQFLFMPLLAYLMCVVFGWNAGTNEEQIWAISFILQGCTPGGSTSNLYTYFSNGDVPLSVCMTITSTICALFMMPLLIAMYAAILGVDSSAVDIKGIVVNLFFIFLPAAAGILVRTKCSAKVADNCVKFGTTLGAIFILFLMVVYVNDSDNIDAIKRAPFSVFFNTIMLGFAGAFFGYITASKIFKLEPRQCRTIAFETGIQNGPLTIGIIIAAFKFTKDYAIDYKDCADVCLGVNPNNPGKPKYGCESGLTELPELASHMEPYKFTFDGTITCDDTVQKLTAALSKEIYAVGDGTTTIQLPKIGGGTVDMDECAAISQVDKAALSVSQEDTVDILCANFYCTGGYQPSFRASYYDDGEKTDPFHCPDPRALMVPFLYTFFICFTSPLMLAFFRFVMKSNLDELYTGDEDEKEINQV